MSIHTKLLIIGAGPYGLSMAAYARSIGLDHVVLGKPMGFWKANMPAGQLFRSACDWHLDPLGVDTVESYLQTRNLTPAEVEPLSVDLFLDYAEWFQQRKGIEIDPRLVTRLDSDADGFRATLDSGDSIVAEKVVVAPGFLFFAHRPAELVAMLPAGRFTHTVDLTDFRPLEGSRCLIIGGRQSAFEWAALAHERGAASIHLSYRHDTPAFTKSDWSWVPGVVETVVRDPGWYRNLSEGERAKLGNRFWAEGRLKLEPWLGPRIQQDGIHLHPGSRLTSCRSQGDGRLEMELDSGATFDVDHVILATGYQVDVQQIPYLREGNLGEAVQTSDGFPVLDETFQSTAAGLYFTSLPATQSFGPFFGFVIGSPAAARVIGPAVTQAQ